MTVPGGPLVGWSWAGTAAFAVTALPAAAGMETAGYAAVVVALALFAGSLPIFLYALVRGTMRTARGERITVSGLFFLRGSAPPAVRRLLLGSLLACLAVVAGTAAAEPFGVLVPVYPLALAALWGARRGTFPPIPEPRP